MRHAIELDVDVLCRTARRRAQAVVRVAKLTPEVTRVNRTAPPSNIAAPRRDRIAVGQEARAEARSRRSPRHDQPGEARRCPRTRCWPSKRPGVDGHDQLGAVARAPGLMPVLRLARWPRLSDVAQRAVARRPRRAWRTVPVGRAVVDDDPAFG